ncbi:sulfatase-like hydrolase/transferase [Planctomycetota bacterium]
MSTAKPNILLIMVDQMNPLLSSMYGDPTAVMPNLDRLAAEGVVFEQAYCNNPLCTPSRASMMTGRLIADMECAFDNGSVLNSEIPTFAHMLNHSGYHTVLSGKMHYVGADQLHGFQERLTTDIYPADLDWSPPGWDLDAPTHADYATRIYENTGRSDDNDQITYDEMVHARALERLKGLAGGDKPFMMCVSYTHPHSPFMAPEKYYSLYDEKEVAAPEMPEDVPGGLDEYNRYLAWDFDYRHIPSELMTRIKQSYYGMFSYLDDKVGEILAALEENGLRDDTVVVFTSDHGEMMGQRGMFEKRTYFEGAVRVPLIVWSPGRFKPQAINHAVSLVDLFPTFSELADAYWSGGDLEGRSLMPALQGDSADLDGGTVITEYFGESIKYPFRAAVRDRLKYVYFPEAPDNDLLFDLAQDPDEENNLLHDQAYKDRGAALLSILEQDFDYDRLRETIDQSHADRQLVRSTYPVFQPDWSYHPPGE